MLSVKSGIEFRMIHVPKSISRIVYNGNGINLRVQVLSYLCCVRFVYYMITNMLKLRVNRQLILKSIYSQVQMG